MSGRTARGTIIQAGTNQIERVIDEVTMTCSADKVNSKEDLKVKRSPLMPMRVSCWGSEKRVCARRGEMMYINNGNPGRVGGRPKSGMSRFRRRNQILSGEEAPGCTDRKQLKRKV